LKVTIDGKTAEVRMPTEEEWARLIRANKILIRQLGGGKTRNEPVDTTAKSAELFRTLGGEGFDPDEAEAAINKLGACGVSDEIEIEGDIVSIPLKIITGSVTVRLRKPKVGERKAYMEARSTVISGQKLTEIRVNPMAAAELFAKLLVGEESKDIPLPAKAVVISELLDFLATGDSESDPT